MFFVFDLSLFFPDPNSVVSGDAVIVPRALKESTLEKGRGNRRTRRKLVNLKTRCTKTRTSKHSVQLGLLLECREQTLFSLRKQLVEKKQTVGIDKGNRCGTGRKVHFIFFTFYNLSYVLTSDLSIL